MKKKEPKVTICPSGFDRAEYIPDLATRLAIERASKEQPALISLASKVPADYMAARDRSILTN